jgi:hypothetical protein
VAAAAAAAAAAVAVIAAAAAVAAAAVLSLAVGVECSRRMVVDVVANVVTVETTGRLAGPIETPTHSSRQLKKISKRPRPSRGRFFLRSE